MQKYTIQKSIDINAPKEKIWDVLLTPENFEKWGAEFHPGSKMIGEVGQDAIIKYVGGEGGGLKTKVIEFMPPDRITLEYMSVLQNFEDDPDETASKDWKGLKETYVLEDEDGKVRVSVTSEVPDKEFYDEFMRSWDKAFAKVKKLAENN